MTGRDDEADRVERAAGQLRSVTGPAPDLAIVLGSGLGSLADEIEEPVTLPYDAIPGFPNVTVAGHAGTLRVGQLSGVRVAALAGRFHLYEGHDAGTVALPVRALARTGVPGLVVTNSAGGINRTFRAGDLMLIDDHINLMPSNPLIGKVLPGEERFPDMSAPYDPEWLRLAADAALAEGIRAVRGVYCGLLGPSYETAAEVRMLHRMGADAVGMSTVLEVIAARAAGMRVLGISIITNPAAGLAPGALVHEDVLAAGERAAVDLSRLLRRIVPSLRA